MALDAVADGNNSNQRANSSTVSGWLAVTCARPWQSHDICSRSYGLPGSASARFVGAAAFLRASTETPFGR